MLTAACGERRLVGALLIWSPFETNHTVLTLRELGRGPVEQVRHAGLP